MEKNDNLTWSLIIGIMLWVFTLILILFWLGNNEAILNIFSAKANEVGDSFGILNSLIGVITLIFLYKTYKNQKKELNTAMESNKKQFNVIKKNQFREFIKFLLEGLSTSINEIQVTGFGGGGTVIISGKNALIGLKQGCALHEGILLNGINKEVWLKHGGLIKFKNILNDIEFIEKYIKENYKGDSLERKDYYFRLIRNRISFSLYELIMESGLKDEARKLKTFSEYEEI